jgi:hypothetical protein
VSLEIYINIYICLYIRNKKRVDVYRYISINRKTKNVEGKKNISDDDEEKSKRANR